jgi:hypothetical protein
LLDEGAEAGSRITMTNHSLLVECESPGLAAGGVEGSPLAVEVGATAEPELPGEWRPGTAGNLDGVAGGRRPLGNQISCCLDDLQDLIRILS